MSYKTYIMRRKEKKLLWVHQGALGDLVSLFPAALALRGKFGRIEGLCTGSNGRLGCRLGVFDASHPIEAAAVASLYSETPDPVLEPFFAAFDAILLFSWSEDLKGRLEHLSGGLVLRLPPRPPPSAPVHVCEHLFGHLENAGLLERGAGGTPDFSSRPRSKQVLLHPGSGSRRKNWPLARFIRTAELLAAARWSPVFLLGPADDHLFRELTAGNSKKPEILVSSDPSHLAAILRASGGFIGNDSGVTHLSAFLGLPTTAIFGPSDPARWRPSGRAVRVIRPELDCAPCFETGERRNCRRECLCLTTPETVAAAFAALMEAEEFS
jgi:heptosyltransferase III